ncbi:MAG TPA: TIGR03618 family F420-dependent PPOX class oxidoreductase [Candidatus Dormibacteraeota bacterium]|nr:TIGR03618 family F420-dependent PPOX class oxidoreductase [Candidatus Dormibacteraeota bacterium]
MPVLTAPTIPASHLDLVDAPPVAALTTLMPDGYPQTSVVWCNTNRTHVLVSTMRGFQKERNMRRDPRVALLCYDPREPLRYLAIQGRVVEMTESGALQHLEALAEEYLGRRLRYFGEVIPAEFAASETPVLCRIAPTRLVAVDARGRRHACAGHGASGDAIPAGAAAVGRAGPHGSMDRATGQGPGTAVPASHLDLFQRPICGVLTTLGADGQPTSSLVWVDHDGECACVNTTLERQKGRDLAGDPRVSLLVVDPDDSGRFVQIRGDGELVEAGALEHLDRLTRRYTRHPAYYGHIYPHEQQALERRVTCRIHARRIQLDAIHR